MLAASLALALAAAPVFDAPFFVQADVVNLRAAPVDGAVVARLRINTPARFVDERGAYLQIAVGPVDDPLVGWVPAELIGDHPVTDDVIEDHLRVARTAHDTEAVVRWLQRSVALRATDEARWVQLQAALEASSAHDDRSVRRVLAGEGPVLVAEWMGSRATLVAVVHPGGDPTMTFGHSVRDGEPEPNGIEVHQLKELAGLAQGSGWFAVTESGRSYSLGGTPVLRAVVRSRDPGSVLFQQLHSVQLEMSSSWDGARPRLITSAPIAKIEGAPIGLGALATALSTAEDELDGWTEPLSPGARVRTRKLGHRSLIEVSVDPMVSWQNVWWLAETTSGIRQRHHIDGLVAGPRDSTGELSQVDSAFKLSFGGRDEEYALFHLDSEGCERPAEVEPGSYAGGHCGGEAGLALFSMTPDRVEVTTVTLSTSGC